MWQAATGSNPSSFSSSELNPVEQVDWAACQKFVEKLNSDGYAPKGFKFRLPTEAEWEYACRAGTRTAYAGENLDSLGWYRDNSKYRTREVGTKSANPWGLYDMHGNVYEWCADKYDSDYYGTTKNAQNPINTSSGWGWAARGGSWNESAANCRSANRFYINEPKDFCGFRLALCRER